MRSLVSWNDGTKALSCRLDRPIDQRKLSDVVLVDHAEHGLLLSHVDLWILDVLLVGRLELTETVIADKMGRLLLRLAIDRAEGRWQTT